MAQDVINMPYVKQYKSSVKRIQSEVRDHFYSVVEFLLWKKYLFVA
jgi:hypothetical protein